MAEKSSKKHTSENDLTDLYLHGRVLPQALEFEEALLGAMMLEQNATGQVIDKLYPEIFYKEAHQIIFKAIYYVYESGNPVDLLSVTEYLRKHKLLDAIGGAYTLAHLTQNVRSSANIEYYARIVSEKNILRQLISISTNVIDDAFEDQKDVLELLDEAEIGLFNIAEKNFNRSGMDMHALSINFIKELETARSNKDHIRGVPSGFAALDRVTNGWQKSNLIIIAARPGMGKTAFVLSMARNMVVERKIPVAFFSLEMSANDLMMRLVSAETAINQSQLKRAALTDDEWNRLLNCMPILEDAPLIIDDTAGLNIFDLKAKCRRLKEQHGVQCIIIDYLQLMNGNKDTKGNREQEIANISRSLKTLAKELDIPIIALSQLSRAVETRSTTTKRPQLSDLRESGAIEQDADMVLFIYRPEYYNIHQFEDQSPSDGLADIIIAKHRNGETTDVRLQFIKEQAKFCDMGFDNRFTDNNIYMTLPSKVNSMEELEEVEEPDFVKN